MKVCTLRGQVMAVLTRNEHCPPHVHVGTAQWDARFEFAFWHDGVRLWDVRPGQREPKVAVLEDLRQALKTPAHLRRARACWWASQRTVCLDNQRWDLDAGEVIRPADVRPSVRRIVSACFDAVAYRTVLQLAGASEPLEIEL